MTAIAAENNVAQPKKAPSTQKPSGSKVSSHEKEPNKGKAPEPSTNAINKDVLLVLQELSAKLTTQNKRIEKQDETIETLVQKIDSFANYDQEEYQYQEQDVETAGSYFSEDNDVDSNEPCLKKQKTSENSVFKNVSQKFQQIEAVDGEVNNDLASFVNSSFRSGISEDKQVELLRDIHRPANCESLVKTRVNHGIWRLLKVQTQTQDSKLKKIQHMVVNAASNVTKLLDKCGDNLDSQDIEWGTNALALMGQANKSINNKRKEMHKYDLDAKYQYLTSSSLPYTDNLYGDDCDVNKNVREINDMNRIGRNVGRGHQSRGSFRGRQMFGNHRGRGRGNYMPQRNDNQNANSKNLRRAPKK